MAKLNIDVKQKDIQRFRALLENDARNGIIGDISTDSGVVTALESVVRGILGNMVQSHETEKKKRDMVIAVDAIDLA